MLEAMSGGCKTVSKRHGPRRGRARHLLTPPQRDLGELQQKLEQIDRAQAKIEKLSGDVLSLQDILSNKQTRGAFGEIQLGDIVLQGAAARCLCVSGGAVERQSAPISLTHLPNTARPHRRSTRNFRWRPTRR